MLVVPDARVAKDTVPVTVDFLNMRARKLSMDESKAEVYSLDPKIDARLPLWEVTRLSVTFNSNTDRWPFIVDGRKHPIFRIQPPSSDTQGKIRHFVTWEAFDVIAVQLIHRENAGNGFTASESQYVDVRAVEAPHGKDKVAQAGKSHHTHGRMPTREEIMAVRNGYFSVLGSSQVENIPAAGCESGQTVAQVPQDAKTMHEATNPTQAFLDALGERQSEGKYPPLV